MYEKIEVPNGVIYRDVLCWENAADFLRNELGLPVVRAAGNQTSRNFFTGEAEGSCVTVYFEDSNGEEIGYWCEGMDTLMVFRTRRKVGKGMESKKTLAEYPAA